MEIEPNEQPPGGAWPAGLQLVLEEARRSLDSQRGDLVHLRQRAAGLTALGGVAVTLVSAVAEEPNGLLLPLALLPFFGVVVLSLLVLYPRQLTFDMDSEMLLKNYVTSRSPGQLAYSHIMDLAEARQSNAAGMRRLNLMLSWALALVGVEIALLVLAAVLG